MSWIRTWGLAAFAGLLGLLLAIFYVLAPWMIETTLESMGGELNRAKVDVASVEVGLMPISLAIKGVDIADPVNENRNRLSWDTLAASVNLDALLWKKWVLDEVTIQGLQPGTPRKVSGRLEDNRFSRHLPEWTLPAMDSLDTGKLLASGSLETEKRVKALNELSETLQAKWKKKLDPTVWQARIQAIRERFETLKSRAKGNRLAMIADAGKWKALKTDVQALKNDLNQLKKELAQDKKRLQKALAAAKAGPDADVDALLAKVGLGDPDDTSNQWLQSAIEPLLKRVTGALAGSSTSEAADDERGTDETLLVRTHDLLTDKTPWPDFLVRKLSGQGQWQGVNLTLKGANLAFPPWQWRDPAVLDMKLDGEAEGKGHVESIWTDKNSMHAVWDIRFKGLPLKSYPLARTSQGMWSLEEGRLDLTWTGETTLEKLGTRLHMTLNHPRWSLTQAAGGWEARLLKALQAQTSLSVTVTASGALGNPDLTIETPLKALLKQVIQEEIQGQLAPVRQRLRAQLTERLGNLSDLQAKVGSLNQFDERLKEQLGFLDDMKGGL
jgi:uncharacterized protein (TIGR03545 family)